MKGAGGMPLPLLTANAATARELAHKATVLLDWLVPQVRFTRTAALSRVSEFHFPNPMLS